MNRFATLALFATLATAAFAQNPPPPPGEPGRPPRGGGDEDRMRLHDQMRSLEERIAENERRIAGGSLSDEEEAKLRAESKKLQAERQEVEAKLRKAGPGEGPGKGDPRMREMRARLEELQSRLRELEAAGNSEEAKRVALDLERVLAELRALESRMPGGPVRPGEPPMGPDSLGPGGPRPLRGVPVSAEDVAKGLAWIGTNEPVRLQRLNDLKQQRPEEYERAVNQVAFEIRELLTIKQNDAKRYERRVEQRKLDYRATELAEKIRGAGENQGMKAEREELRGILGKLFDLREDDRELELKRLEEELARLKDTMKKRKDAKDKIIEKRMSELLGEEDDLQWEPGGPGSKPGEPPPAPRDR
ncbi:MAG: hypothetical protein FD180_4254 [Planctomycetota bacterium]|nr:MAG: hypothetical protein FD180_4254 [Planctomycetota bacterium]